MLTLGNSGREITFKKEPSTYIANVDNVSQNVNLCREYLYCTETTGRAIANKNQENGSSRKHSVIFPSSALRDPGVNKLYS